MSNHVKYRDAKRKGARAQHISRKRKTRPKTFKTEEAANTWAKTNNIEKFSLENLRNDNHSKKKIRIIAE